VLHVKALIRERGNPRYRWASLVYHGLAFVASLWFGVALAVVFGLLAVRAWVLAGRTLRPGVLGIVEIVASLALLGALTVS
jgi:ABC-type proline/glycine betaine transport system permease subunit